MNMDVHKSESSTICSVRCSCRVGTDISFETLLERHTNCEVHVFDPSEGELPFSSETQC